MTETMIGKEGGAGAAAEKEEEVEIEITEGTVKGIEKEKEILKETERSRKRKDQEAVVDHEVLDTRRARRIKRKEVIAMTGRTETLPLKLKRNLKIKSETLNNDTMFKPNIF